MTVEDKDETITYIFWTCILDLLDNLAALVRQYFRINSFAGVAFSTRSRRAWPFDLILPNNMDLLEEGRTETTPGKMPSA